MAFIRDVLESDSLLHPRRYSKAAELERRTPDGCFGRRRAAGRRLRRRPALTHRLAGAEGSPAAGAVLESLYWLRLLGQSASVTLTSVIWSPRWILRVIWSPGLRSAMICSRSSEVLTSWPSMARMMSPPVG